MPKETQNNNLTISQQPQQHHMEVSAMYIGPIPDAAQLEKYEQICPGAADRIISMAESQAHHRQMLESMAVKSNAKNSTLGVIFAFVIGMLTIIGGVFLAYSGLEWPGAIIGSTGLIGLVSVFIYGTRSSRQERAKKEQQF